MSWKGRNTEPNGRLEFRASFLVVGLATIGCFTPAHANDRQGTPNGGIGYSLSATPFHQFKSDLDGGGNLSVSRVFLDAGGRKQISDRVNVGLSLGYDFEDYDFSGSTDLLSSNPWDKIHRPSVGAFIGYETESGWKGAVGPRVGFSRESGASWQDSLTYGAVFTVARQFHPRLELGLGVGVFKRVEKRSVFPFLRVNWQITDRLRLANPFRAGPAGPAGLALSYTPSERWEFALGAALRRFRFRLNDSGPAPDGVGEARLLPVFAKVTRKFDPRFRLDAYVGAAFRGQVKLEDEDGDQLRADNHDPAPLLGLTLAGRF